MIIIPCLDHCDSFTKHIVSFNKYAYFGNDIELRLPVSLPWYLPLSFILMQQKNAPPIVDKRRDSYCDDIEIHPKAKSNPSFITALVHNARCSFHSRSRPKSRSRDNNMEAAEW